MKKRPAALALIPLLLLSACAKAAPAPARLDCAGTDPS